MNNDQSYEFITAYVDGELHDDEKIKIERLIKSDPAAKYEYNLQKLVKRLVKEKCSYKTVPGNVRAKIIHAIEPENERKIEESILTKIFARPFIAFGTAAIIIFAAILLLINRPAKTNLTDFRIEQRGSQNMFVQAENNFQSLVAGKLVPQIISSNPEEIKEFFKENGVRYNTVIPRFKQWKLLGGVVSVDNGEKFAHHVYAAPNGKLVYVFQVNEDYIKHHINLYLSEDLINYVDEGNCYQTKHNGTVAVITKVSDNILAVVSNLKPAEVYQQFCSIK